jgi:glycosyltransferase involved in cell wall biosynthesis
MRILLISVKSNISRGGIATWTERFLKNCNEHEIYCDLVNTEMIGKRSVNGTSRRNFLDEIIRTFRIFRDLKQCLKHGVYDVAHLNTSCGSFGLLRDYFIAKCIKRKGIKLITHFHCDIPDWIKNTISHMFLGKLVTLSNECLVLCEKSRVFLEEGFNVASQKVPNFLDDELIRADNKPISNNLRTALFVGRVSRAKGAYELYALAKKFHSIEFRLVGEVDKEIIMLEKPENVTLVGSLTHNEVLFEMDKADIFVFPSHSEGFSLALIEAMARGLPIVATDVGAAIDMLSNGCGIITYVEDVKAMAEAIERLNDLEVRKNISDSAINKVRTQYTTGTILEVLKRYYQKKGFNE